MKPRGSKIPFSALSIALFACGGAPAEDAELVSRTDFVSADVALPATLTFDSSWNETVSGTIVAGGRIRLQYQEARLPRCRASHNGNPGWQITAFVRFAPSGQVEEAEIFGHAMTPTGPDYYSWIPQEPELEVPAGVTELEVWFRNRSGFDFPCEDWDSDYGRNYRFAVSAPERLAVMDFQSDWQNVLSGEVVRGGALAIRYASERMRAIVGSAQLNGVPYFASRYHCYGYGCCSFEYDNAVHLRFRPDAPFERQPIGDHPVVVSVPADASQVEVYFDTAVTTTTWYCGGAEGERYRQPTLDSFYDSNYGQNFVYRVP